MPAVEFSNCGNLRISFYSKNTCAYLSVVHSRNCLRLFLLDSQGTYWVHSQTVELNEILLWLQFPSQRFREPFCYNNLTWCKAEKRFNTLQSQQVPSKKCSMTAQKYAKSYFLNIWSYNNLFLNPRYLTHYLLFISFCCPYIIIFSLSDFLTKCIHVH